MKEKILERIKNCLAIGNDKRNKNLNEIKNAMDMADKLMVKYNIKLSEVPSNDTNSFNISRDTALKKTVLLQWEQLLIATIVNLFTVKCIIGKVQNYKYVVFLGVCPEQSVAASFYNNLRKQIRGMANNTRYINKQKRDYINGVVLSINNTARFIKARREYKESNDFTQKENEACRSVVIKKSENLNRHMEKLKLDETSQPKVTVSKPGAFYHGLSDGQNVDLKTRNILENK